MDARSRLVHGASLAGCIPRHSLFNGQMRGETHTLVVRLLVTQTKAGALSPPLAGQGGVQTCLAVPSTGSAGASTATL
jgi:hypothetical protein